jgi:phosphoesterase RecJ-like protein
MPRYKIPLKDSLVVGHVNPDGDSLSSTKAVVNYLRAAGKIAFAKVVGKVPEHLEWIIPEEDRPKNLPDFEQTIVLDCGPYVERVGFDIEGPVFNIDHHMTRHGEHSPKNKIYVLRRCSVASALILDFGLTDDILLVGLYTDTQFMRSWNELLKCFAKLKVSDERAQLMISACRPTRDKKAFAALRNAKIHRCRNGFLIAEVDETDPSVVQEVAETLFRYSESFCLIDGNNQVKLRTSNENLDVGSIAKIFGGGGHTFASGFSAEGKRTALLATIKQLEIQPMILSDTVDDETIKQEKEEEEKK